MSKEKVFLPDIYTVCMYMRLSNEDDYIPKGKLESGSITAQRGLIRDYLRRHDEFKNCRVIERYDDGLSGRYFDSRPGFTEMIELCKQGKINCVIVKDCSRFGRDYVELGDYLEQLFPFMGIRFISINDHYDSDHEEGGLDIAFKNLVYDYYSRDLSKKEKIAKTKMAEQGKYGASQELYGYRKKPDDKHSLEVDAEAAEVVKEIFAMRLQGIGPTLIARKLNERGILSPTEYRISKGLPVVHRHRKGNPGWNPSQIDAMLKNEGYTGAVISHKIGVNPITGKTMNRPKSEWIVVPNMHEAIIPADDFKAVQKMRRRDPDKKKPVKKIFYRCGICGRTMYSTTANLYCSRKYSAPETECAGIWMKKTEADEAVLVDLKIHLDAFFEEKDRLMKKRAEGISPESEIKEAEKDLKTVERDKRFLFEKLADRSIDRETFKAKKAEYDARIEVLKDKINTIMASLDEKNEITIDRSVADAKKLTKDLWGRYIESAEVFPNDRIVVKLKF